MQVHDMDEGWFIMGNPGKFDRTAGVMVGMACGDALGAAYEFDGPYPADMPVEMKGGGPFGWEPGEWTDDTSMAIPLLQTIHEGSTPHNERLGSAVDSWLGWMRVTKDVGNQTSAVLREVQRLQGHHQALIRGKDDLHEVRLQERAAFRDDPEATELLDRHEWGFDSAEEAFVQAASFQKRCPDAAGNGSLMRTAPYGLMGSDLDYAARTAPSQSALTHAHIDALTACALWSAAINHAVTTGELDVRIGLRPEFLRYSIGCTPGKRGNVDELADLWEKRIQEAEEHPPEHFGNNGWVVQSFQAAWSSIVRTGNRADNDPGHVRRALEAAVRSGGDTDTVAAIAGGLIGGAYGVSAIPLEWKRRIHGWPGWRAEELVESALIAQSNHSDKQGIDEGSWPMIDRMDYGEWLNIDTCVPHPHDSGVYIGSVGVLDQLPREVDAVVSLCRIGRRQVPDSIDRENRVSVWLVDSEDPRDNANIDFVLAEAADMVARMRVEGKIVFLHCVQAHSRTPSVAALYSAKHLGMGVEEALGDVIAALPNACPNPAFTSAIRRIIGKETTGA